MKFRATILEMASSEIMQHIPASVYEEIKTRDSHPVFRAYVIGHEGISEGKVVGHGNIVKRWFESAIHGIVEKLQYGTKIFHGHGMTNEHGGRQSIGEVVGKTKERIKGKLSAIAIMYMKPAFRDLPLDVCSMEADITLNNDQNRGIYDADVEKITAIALGNRAVSRPGFPGAELVVQLQEMANQSQFNTGGDEMGNTISDIKKVIKAEGYVLTDLFSMGDITKDPMIEEHIGRIISDRRKVINDGFDKTKEELIKEYEKKIKEKDDSHKTKDDLIAKLQGENIQSKTGEWLTVEKDKRKLSDEQMKFIKLNKDEFKPKDHEKAEDEYRVFLDSQIDKLNSINKDVFGKEDDPKDKAPGGESKDKKGGEDFIEDMSLED